MSMKHFLRLIIIGLLSFALGACSSLTGSSYNNQQTRQAQTVTMGKIIQLDYADIQADNSGVGTAAGAVVGGVAGSTIGRGKGRVLGALGGAVLGGLAGTGIEHAVGSKDGVEITVQLDNGQTIAVVQQLGDEEKTFAVGDRVRVLQSGSTTRVRR